MVDQAQASKLAEWFGSEADVEVDPAGLVRSLERGEAIEIGPLTVRPKRLMHLERYVVLGWDYRDLADLKADGCFTELRGSKTWLHVPVSDEPAIKVVANLINRFGSRPPSPDA